MKVPPRSLLAEAFAAANLAFLVLDVALAHSANAFRARSEWVPVFAAGACAATLAVGLVRRAPFDRGAGYWIGVVVAAISVAVGLTGLLLHLESQFFRTFTLGGLVYSAPFAAPLAFAGLGLLVLLNRLVPAESVAWGQWVCLLALGGFVGNFALSLADHAQNGFFHLLEWVPVFAAALAVGFFSVAVLASRAPALARLLWVVLVVQATTGILGFVLHLGHLADPVVTSLRDRVLYGAPLFAPLLFADLALLGALGVWDLQAKGLLEGRAEGNGLDAESPENVGTLG